MNLNVHFLNCFLHSWLISFLLHFISTVYPLFCFLVSPSGDSDSNPRHRSDPGLVPADPWEAAGPEHHGSGLQQHRSHAGRVLPCLQDRVLSFMMLAVLSTHPSIHPPIHPSPLHHLLSLEVEREWTVICFFKASLMVPVSKHLLQPLIC